MTKQRVLIPGGAGYIGSHIVLCVLLTRKYTVTVVDNFHNSFPESMTRVSQIARDELPADASQEDKDACTVDVVKGDMRDAKVLDGIFADYKQKGDAIWSVILVAALKAVGESGEIPIDYYEVNVSGLITLLRVMQTHEVTRLVYSSSATVYGIPKTIPIPESTPLAAESVYGRTKQMSELIIKDVCDAYPKTWRAIGLRYFNPAGAHPSGLIGEDPVGKPGNLLPLLAQMAVGKYRDPGLRVFGDDYPTPDGTCVRDYIHIMDLAGGHVNALEALDDDAKFKDTPTPGKYKAYNLGKGKGMSVLQMIDAMRKVSGYEYPYKVEGRRLGDVPDLTADPTLAEKELGFKAKYNLDDMASSLWNWQSKNPKGYTGQ
ncbi:UDP-glucose 4-epimerase [Tilletiopsis washingtonensis]|uniref:UDP-glucose 4-epimerase n=1 Tax=Tilletiopsis washingtonensis TaxID=58919 RepID=A0A316ZGP1_9BASI|nr:UDP-glucose 4-epimerase [Tilletiopsis washingtonensis]PWO00417.1 UDP-glucose 4-epimerase [Tilletiopsis washingtonensis]